ncbi:hypothetical protein [Vibrio coralliilyticus]|uniref:hypothetical protein n=1 Tax=Vibrio coralliilyticus TaxID=190893 RepID=UPI0020B7499F|nr:hypothetical protein [Vibrio coralliilyticus]
MTESLGRREMAGCVLRLEQSHGAGDRLEIVHNESILTGVRACRLDHHGALEIEKLGEKLFEVPS